MIKRWFGAVWDVLSSRIWSCKMYWELELSFGVGNLHV